MITTNIRIKKLTENFINIKNLFLILELRKFNNCYIMQKLYYSISEVSKIVDEEQHILRYWEKEFEVINPKKNRAGNRVYSERDITIIKTVKKLLREDKLSLRGAKEQLNKFNFTLPTEDLMIGFEPIEETISDSGIKSNPDNKIFVNKLKELKSLLLEIKDSISS